MLLTDKKKYQIRYILTTSKQFLKISGPIVSSLCEAGIMGTTGIQQKGKERRKADRHEEDRM